MRINIYSEELTPRIEKVTTEAEGRIFYGLRFYLKTHEDLVPPKHADDDTSAVTFWCESEDELASLMRMALGALTGAETLGDAA